jgi:aldehyde:ferredoxin oxidoreductase
MAEKIYRVNMTTLSASSEDVPAQWKGLGGRGLTSSIVAQEFKPTCHPLGKYNKLVSAPGLLTGTACANSGRLSAGAKSPLTGTIKESNAGGTAAQLLARLGIKAIIIEGVPQKETFYSLHVDKKGVTIREETELVGRGNYEVMQALQKKHGEKIGILAIGPGRGKEDGGRQYLDEGSRRYDSQPWPLRAGGGHGFEEDQVHYHR